MREYYAQSTIHGFECGHSFEAEDDDEAQWFADKMGWFLIGEYIDDRQEVEAMLELNMTNPSVH